MEGNPKERDLLFYSENREKYSIDKIIKEIVPYYVEIKTMNRRVPDKFIIYGNKEKKLTVKEGDIPKSYYGTMTLNLEECFKCTSVEEFVVMVYYEINILLEKARNKI